MKTQITFLMVALLAVVISAQYHSNEKQVYEPFKPSEIPSVENAPVATPSHAGQQKHHGKKEAHKVQKELREQDEHEQEQEEARMIEKEEWENLTEEEKQEREEKRKMERKRFNKIFKTGLIVGSVVLAVLLVKICIKKSKCHRRNRMNQQMVQQPMQVQAFSQPSQPAQPYFNPHQAVRGRPVEAPVMQQNVNVEEYINYHQNEINRLKSFQQRKFLEVNQPTMRREMPVNTQESFEPMYGYGRGNIPVGQPIKDTNSSFASDYPEI